MSGPDSLRAAGHALLYWQRRQEVNTNNLANAETPGFRAERVFAEVLEGGLPTLGTATDTRAGELRETGGPLDLALAGRGNFVVQTADGEELVRSGSFSLSAEGQIIDQHGNALLGSNGPLILPPGPVEIDARGGVSVDGELVGRIRVVADRPTAETRSGTTRSPGEADPVGAPGGESRAFSLTGALDSGASTGTDEIPPEDFVVRQGYIEGSNVSALDSLIELTTIQRSFEAVRNSVRAIDSVMETVANRLGRVD